MERRTYLALLGGTLSPGAASKADADAESAVQDAELARLQDAVNDAEADLHRAARDVNREVAGGEDWLAPETADIHVFTEDDGRYRMDALVFTDADGPYADIGDYLDGHTEYLLDTLGLSYGYTIGYTMDDLADYRVTRRQPDEPAITSYNHIFAGSENGYVFTPLGPERMDAAAAIVDDPRRAHRLGESYRLAMEDVTVTG